MTNIFVKVNGASIQATVDGKITSGMVGLPVEISYDDSWQGLYKTAFFKSGNFIRKVDSVSNSAVVPWEVLRKPGSRLEVGVEGRTSDGDIVIPTIWATAGMIFQGAKGDIPAAPVTGSDIDPGTADGYIDSSGKARGNIDMDGHAIMNAGFVNINHKGEEGVAIYSGLYEGIDGETDAAVAEFYGTKGDEKVRLRNLAPGVNNDDSVTVGQMNAVVGDIETALDAILAIQEELIGGDAV